MTIKIRSPMMKINIILFFLVVFFLTRQIPLSEYSVIMNVALVSFALFAFVGLFKSTLKKNNFFPALIAASLVGLVVLSLYSISKNNEPNYIIRWLIILSLLIIAYIVRPNKNYVDIFIVTILIQAVFINLITLILIFGFTLNDYTAFRQLFVENDWGDVYTYNGIFWHVKIHGSALLPVGLFVSFLYLKGWKRLIVITVVLPSIVVSNTAFVLATLIFFAGISVIRIKWNYVRAVEIMVVCLAAISFTYYFSDGAFSEKDTSMAVRLDQVEVLTDDLIKTYAGMLFGTGIGHTLSVTTVFRDYTDNTYFELQPMYVLNQLGFIPFALYVLLHLALTLKFIRHKELLLVYICYLFYASTNPYIFDTSHFVTIVVLISLKKIMDEKYLRSLGHL